ncbi:hypothetical protein HBE96_13030 [Clostridium sp. P21]|uniref:ABC transporter permease n=1 Tax=Clostridium muellerianum TaxID=2716538 RepID=A0A7Y0EI69_9CLOT|nr:FtsX-like permease family protein [Clostridium muellerianum]NMM63582.1 hypothetical protein [Clostridium muellerianum]
MKTKFCFKLAINNLKRNKQIYIPYLIASISTIFTFLVYVAIGTTSTMTSLPLQSEFVQTFFKVGTIIIGLFSVFFLIYANSFLMKQRMKEFGLFSILGLEKRHMILVLFFETIFIAITSFICTLILGLVFGNIFFRLFVNIMHLNGENYFFIGARAITKTFSLLAIIYGIVFGINIFKIHHTKTISLLKSNSIGEKEPKGHSLIAIVGFVLLIFSYLYALSATKISDLILFTPILMTATYLVFIAGSIAILKAIKKNEKLYYKPQNFISVSNLMYRMKKNGVGLASICIFSTAIIFLLSVVFSVYFGKDNMLKTRFPNSIEIKATENLEGFYTKIHLLAKNNNITLNDKQDDFSEADNQYTLSFNTEGTEKNRIAFAKNIKNSIKEKSTITYFASRDLESLNWYNYFGGGLFLCVFMGVLFLIALILILYYKQLSEGIEDKKQFQILQDVGMDKCEIKSTINQQVKLMFFLPIGVTILHMIVGYNLICRVLAGFHLSDTLLIFKCILIVIIVFFFVYVAAYKITSNIYYKIIN